MSLAPHRRVSLILPVGSSRAGIAAIRVVLYLLRTVRVELDLLRGPAAEEAALPSQAGSPGAVLFVRAISEAPDGSPISEPDFERGLRSHIERSYRRLGIGPVEYELEIL